MTRRQTRPTRLARLAFVGAAVASAVTVSGCANSAALGLARQACNHVNRSVTLYRRSLGEPPTTSTADQQQAETQLRLALPDAATAAGEEPQWQGLMTTISEGSRVPESYLVSALAAQCQIADSPGGEGGTETPVTAPTSAPPATAPPATKPTNGG